MTLGERLAEHGLELRPGHRLVSMADRPDLRGPLGDLNVSVWPEFMLHDPVADELWDSLFTAFAPYQACLFDDTGDLVAGLNSAPLAWTGRDDDLPDGWDDQFLRSVDGHEGGVPPDTLGALLIVVRQDRQGRGYSGVMVSAMRANARSRGFHALIACARPTEKVAHPRTPIDEYARWTREDGLPADAWIRLHVRLGGRIVRASPASMRIEGSLDEWREWTGLELPTSGDYVPEGAAAPVAVDVEADRGVYLDPNVWVVHDLR